MNKSRKAVVAAAVPVLSTLLMWAATGELGTQELALGLTGLITAALVWLVPNDKPESAESLIAQRKQRIN